MICRKTMQEAMIDGIKELLCFHIFNLFRASGTKKCIYCGIVKSLS